MSITSEIANIINTKGIKYNDLKVRLSIIEYRKEKDRVKKTKLLQDIIEQCYPILLGVIKSFVTSFDIKKHFVTFEADDLLSEAIIVTKKCIDGYSFKSSNKFVTYLWGSNIKHFYSLRKTDSLVKETKREDCKSINYIQDLEDVDGKNYSDKFLFDARAYSLIDDRKINNRHLRKLMIEQLSYTEFKVFVLYKIDYHTRTISSKLKLSERKVAKTIIKIQNIILKEIENGND